MQVEFHEVHKRYTSRHVLQGVSLTMDAGQFVTLLGPSGCGKTTMLNALAGLVDIDGGSITVDGEMWSRPGATRPPEQRRIGMVFQDFALWPHMSVFQNVAFGLKLRKLPSAQIHARVQEVLDLVHMSGYTDAYPQQLSGGQKQRIAIARALAPRPSLLLMDEPLSNLDAKLREEMRWELARICRETQITALYVTHDQMEALSMSDYVVLMREGRIEQQGTPDDMYRNPHTVFAASFLGASNLLPGEVVRHDDGSTVVQFTDHLTLRIQATAPVGAPVTVMIRPTDMTLLPIRDDDVLIGQPDRAQTLHFPGPESVNAWRVHVRQRAFLGATWQYRLSPMGETDLILECWSNVDIPVGGSATLCIPFAHAHVLSQDDKVPPTTVSSEALRQVVGQSDPLRHGSDT